jgi:hypothetical protein
MMAVGAMMVVVAVIVVMVVVVMVVMMFVVMVVAARVMIVVMMMAMMLSVVGRRRRRHRQIDGRSRRNVALQRRTPVNRFDRNACGGAGQSRRAFGGGRGGEHQQRSDGGAGHRREIQAGRATQLNIAHDAPLVMVNENIILEERVCASAPISLAGYSGYQDPAWRRLRPALGRFAPRD